MLNVAFYGLSGACTRMSKDEIETGGHIKGPRLVVTRGETSGRVFKLEPGNNLIGRWDPDSGSFPEVDLEEEDVEAKVSRKHAVINVAGEVVTLEDIGSLNGTYVNRGQRLEERQKIELSHGDEIIIGKVFLRFEND
ncbi:MAG: FHA domain-containing protein [Candidatus Dadabacteria bacterium]|nr:MAG: FHA domain-containing protein [Candidatus Dadabacteria bacterium]